MRLTAEQFKVLSTMTIGLRYTARDLKARYTTLNRLAVMGLVGESLLHQVWAFFLGDLHKRQFMITEEGTEARRIAVVKLAEKAAKLFEKPTNV